MYGLAGYKNTPGMPDMNKKVQKLLQNSFPYMPKKSRRK